MLCRQPKRAGVYLMGTDGEIPPHSTTYLETACSYNEPVVMHPFAYRTHAHTHGTCSSLQTLGFCVSLRRDQFGLFVFLSQHHLFPSQMQKRFSLIFNKTDFLFFCFVKLCSFLVVSGCLYSFTCIFDCGKYNLFVSLYKHFIILKTCF